MIRPILKYGAPQLIQPSHPVEHFDGNLASLAGDMLETMYDAPGIGLAAPQLGVNKRLIVVDILGGLTNQQLVLVNPQILSSSGWQESEEGCLSIPGFTTMVRRPHTIKVQAQDLTGKSLEFESEELLAVALCHEIDHLDGILYLDRISRLRRDLIKRKIRKLVKAGEW